MEGPDREKFQELCEQAANEKDPGKLLELIEQIIDLLTKKQRPFSTGETQNSS